MKIRVSELAGAKLDYWVAKAEGEEPALTSGGMPVCVIKVKPAEWTYSPSTLWEQGGPLVEKHRVSVSWFDFGNAWISTDKKCKVQLGQTPLEAICRAVVSSVYGEEVEDEN